MENEILNPLVSQDKEATETPEEETPEEKTEEETSSEE